MNLFDNLVREQLKTMDELLKLQTHLEYYQRLADAKCEEVDAKELHFIRQEIYKTELGLKVLQENFERQTTAVIQSFENERAISG